MQLNHPIKSGKSDFPCLLSFQNMFLFQRNSRRSTRGCPRTTSWMCQPSSTCGHWMLRSSGGTSSWRPVCASCPGEHRESSSNCSASVKDATGSLRSTSWGNGEHKSTTRLHSIQTSRLCISFLSFFILSIFVVYVTLPILSSWHFKLNNISRRCAYVSRGLVVDCAD